MLAVHHVVVTGDQCFIVGGADSHDGARPPLIAARHLSTSVKAGDAQIEG